MIRWMIHSAYIWKDKIPFVTNSLKNMMVYFTSDALYQIISVL
jgi:hypothetical protein